MAVEGTREHFMKAAEKSAKFIHDGGLKEPPGISQTEEEAWEQLETINAKGFITFTSQGGELIKERAYVRGWMFHEDARRFVEYLNLWSDKVAFLSFPVKDGDQHFAPIAVTKDFRKGVWGGFTNLHYYTTEYCNKMEKKEAGLSSKFPTIEVSVFDPTWGRPAWSENGLLKDILEALNPREHPANELDASS